MGIDVRVCGDSAFLLTLGNTPHPALSRRIESLRRALVAARPPGFIEAVTGLVTLMVIYDPDLADMPRLADVATRLLDRASETSIYRAWTFPVCYEAPYAPDLAAVADASGVAPETVVKLHTDACYTVYLLGFSPGFPYLGDIDARIALPRRAEPRSRVPAGSVAIATRYTSIYPQETPGGWHLIGRTPVRLFDARAEHPALLAPGDAVRFAAVTRREFETLAANASGYMPEYVEVTQP